MARARIAEIRALGQIEQGTETRGRAEIDQALGVVVGRADLAPSGRLGLDPRARGLEPGVSEAQEDQPQNRGTVLGGLQAGIRPQLVSRIPQAVLQFA